MPSFGLGLNILNRKNVELPRYLTGGPAVLHNQMVSFQNKIFMKVVLQTFSLENLKY